MNQRQFAEATELRAQINEARVDIRFWKGEGSTKKLVDVRPDISTVFDREFLTEPEIERIKIVAIKRLEKQISSWEEKFAKL